MRTRYLAGAVCWLVGLGAVVLACRSWAQGAQAVRTCSSCVYKSTVTFTGLPLGTITSATMQVKVKHQAACPQQGYPSGCKEVLAYDVRCAVGTVTSVVLPFFIDAAASNTSHSAKLTVVRGGVTTVHVGTVDLGSNVAGGASPPSSMPTPCPPPAVDPYVTPPAVE